MSISGASGVADLEYGAFYIPSISVIYLSHYVSLPYTFEILGVYLFTVHSNLVTPLFLLTLIGGLVKHGMTLSIYGPAGARENPKNPGTVLYQKIALIFFKAPKERPEHLHEYSDRIGSVLDEIRSASTLGRLTFYIKTITRIPFIWLPYTIHSIVGVLSIPVLLQVIKSGDFKLIGAILLIAQFVILLRPIVFGRFASVVDPDSAKWLYVPEHRKSPRLHESDEIEFEHQPNWLEEIHTTVEEIEEKENTDDVPNDFSK